MAKTRWAPVLVLAALAAACDQGPMAPVVDLPQDVSFDIVTPPTIPTASAEKAWVCKVGPQGENFDFLVSGNFNLVPASFTLAAGSCIQISQRGGLVANVTVTEDNDTNLNRIEVFQFANEASPQITMTTVTGSPTATGAVGGNTGTVGTSRGVVFVFYNDEPPGGGQGCTPGYWKQPHHFDSWVGYAPTDLFSSVFEDAFPGMTLHAVLSQGGGGLNALGRHTVAALLNSANGGVSYNVTTAGVISAFNNVFPGTKDDYNGLKDIFEGFNEQGCPLN